MNDTPDIQRTSDAEVIIDLMKDIGHHDAIPAQNGFETAEDATPFTTANLISLPRDRRVEDLTAIRRAAAEYLRPARRRGTARLDDLQSLIDWTNRFKGDTSALFAKPDMANPTLTAIADYHAEGPADSGDAAWRYDRPPLPPPRDLQFPAFGRMEGMDGRFGKTARKG